MTSLQPFPQEQHTFAANCFDGFDLKTIGYGLLSGDPEKASSDNGLFVWAKLSFGIGLSRNGHNFATDWRAIGFPAVNMGYSGNNRMGGPVQKDKSPESQFSRSGLPALRGRQLT